MTDMESLPAPIISIRGVAKKFRLFDSVSQRLREALHPFRKQYHREFWALRDISFDVPRGSCFGIIGRNGSGKSTLLKIIAGVMQPSAGEVAVSGRVAALLELGAGFNPDLTGRENARLQLQIAAMPPEQMQSRLEEIERFADIGEFFDQPVRIYSSGMFVRVAFAAAISVEPEILIVDEALAVGDASFQQKCFARLRELQNAGMTLLIVTHDIATIVRICDQCLVLDSHKAVFKGAPRLAANVYENILFGTAKRTAAMLENGNQAPSFVSLDHSMAGLKNPIINPDHSRLGDGRAELLDFMLSAGDRVNAVQIKSGEELIVSARFRFNADCSSVAFGIGITTREGVMVFGTNTDIMGYAGANVKIGEVLAWHARIKPNLAMGKYFLNVGCTEINALGPIFLDSRRAIALLDVEAPKHANGVAVFECSIERVGLDGEEQQ